LPKRLCTRCVLPDSYPEITFDYQGICSICKQHDKWTREWKSELPKRKKILLDICAKAKKKDKEFDALIPYSGGKDSTYVLYVSKEELGLNCLAYTFDNGYLSDYARNNIDKTCKKLGVEHIYYRFNPDLMNRLYALFVRKTGYPCSVCMRAIAVGIDKVAELYDIPIIISGTSSRTELLGTNEMSEHGSRAHMRAVLKGEPIALECKRILSTYNNRRKIGHVLFRLAGRKRLISYAWFQLADYIDWNYRNIQETIVKELGWESPGESEHMDCIIHPLQNYIQMRRFPEIELDRLKFAKLIMVGQMTREEALYKLQNSKTQDSKQALDRFLKDIKMTEEEFDKYIDMGPRHLQYYAPTLMEKLVKKVFNSQTS
jgi:N-acetyl sugar amidotransferase